MNFDIWIYSYNYHLDQDIKIFTNFLPHSPISITTLNLPPV